MACRLQNGLINLPEGCRFRASEHLGGLTRNDTLLIPKVSHCGEAGDVYETCSWTSRIIMDYGLWT